MRAATLAHSFLLLQTLIVVLRFETKRKCQREILRVELRRGGPTFLCVFPLDAKVTDKKLWPSFWPALHCKKARLAHPFRELRGGGGYLGC